MKRFAQLSLIFLAALLVLPAAALAASGDTIPGHPDVIGEYVQIPGADATGTPDVFNTATYMRVRLAADGKNPKPAHAVVIAQPGFASTPAIWSNVAADLVEKATARTCGEKKEAGPCRVEVWIMDRRGSQMEDTSGLRTARANDDPLAALDYYYGAEILAPPCALPPPPGSPAGSSCRVPLADLDDLIALPFGTFEPLTQDDVRFMSEWGFETMAADVDALIKFIPKGEKDGNKNIFLAGHSQGGGFVSLYGGRRLADGRRGHENLAGLIFLDGGPSVGSNPAPTPADINDYLTFVGALRGGFIDVYGTSLGPIALNTGLGVQSAVLGTYQDQTPSDQSIFIPNSISNFPFFSPEFVFLLNLRHTYRANAGFAFDTDPLPCTTSPMTFGVVQFLGQRMGELDYPPFTGTAFSCDPAPGFTPFWTDLQLHDWIDGGGTAPAGGEPSDAASFSTSNGYGPAFTNVEPVTATFPTGRVETIDAGEMNGFTWYQSVRYDGDSGFLGGFQVVNFDIAGVSFDIDRTTIAAPVYVSGRGFSTTNPYPLVDDFTRTNSFGTVQSSTAAALSPISPLINSSQYGHTDFVTADDSQAGVRAPGQAGASLVSNTLIDWLLARSEGRSSMPRPKKLGVVQTR